MKLAQRLSTLESQMKDIPQINETLYFQRLLSDPERNENDITAATLLALKDVIDEPVPSLWEQLLERMNSLPADWANTRLMFAVAYQELDHAVFDAEDGKEWLCWLALCYLETFEAAPQPSDAHQQVLRRDLLYCEFLIPLLERACPELHGYSTATFTGWLESAGSTPSDARLASLRTYAASLKR